MQSPSLNLVSHTHYYCGGNVTIAPTAAIASGVVLQALPGSAIEIQSGACLGAGVVIQARTGKVVIGSGASLGTGVLIVGAGSIGQGACIGPASTLINPAIKAQTVVPPNSLQDSQGSTADQRSDTAHSASTQAATSTNGYFNGGQSQASNGPGLGHSTFSGPSQVPITPRASTPVSPKPVNIPGIPAYGSPPSEPSPPTNSSSAGESQDVVESTSASLVVNQSRYVYGRDQVNGLLSALFPYRQPLNDAQNQEGS